MESICAAVKNCTARATSGFLTCSIPSHRQRELDRRAQGQAFFRLRQRLEGYAAAAAMRTFSSDNAAQEMLDDAEIAQEVHTLLQPKPSQKNPPEQMETAKSSLTRRWTFNEQLMVRPCGIILSRATFYEAEGPANALVSPSKSHVTHHEFHTMFI